MVPAALLRRSYRVHGDVVVPRFLAPHDHVWLRALLEEYERFVGRRRRELDARLREPAPYPAPEVPRALAIAVLDRLWGSVRGATVPARRARQAVFDEAARGEGRAREDVLGAVAATLGVSTAELDEALFADLPAQRRLAPLERPLSPGELALRTNLGLVQALLHRAESVAIAARGNARALVRHAQLRGLICAVTRPGDGPADAFRLEVSGPLALFRRTALYGRALGELVPLLAWCERFRLRAPCVLGGRHVVLELGAGDPIFPAAEPRRYDSRLEERFARDFARAAPAWNVVREPEPVTAGAALVFPDFALEHRDDPRRRWLLEIVGFWTPEYVARKLAHYRAAARPDLVLCIDAERDCAAGDLPADARVVRFRRRIDVADVLRVLGEVPRPARRSRRRSVARAG